MKSSRLSIAQRMAAYLITRDRIMNQRMSKYNPGVCLMLGKFVSENFNESLTREVFQEFDLFMDPDVHCMWFWRNEEPFVNSISERNEMRVFMLQLCIEMLKK